MNTTRAEAIQMDIQAAIRSGKLIPNAHLQNREVRPGTSFRIGPVTISKEWGPALQCWMQKSAVRTDNGPAVSHGETVFTLPDGKVKRFGWMSGFAPSKWGYEIIEGKEPESPNPKLPFKGVSKHNAPQPGSGHSKVTTSKVPVTVRFAGEERVELASWLRTMIEVSFKKGVNPLPYLRDLYPGQWSFARYNDGRGMIHYAPASPRPVWSGDCEAEIPCD